MSPLSGICDECRSAPVALFAYNRPDHLRQVITHLQANPLVAKTPLYVFCDGARDESQEAGVHAVREMVRTTEGFASVTVVHREGNWGLRRSVIDGVTQVASEHGRVIVVEDDIITSRSFLRFMNEALDFYEDFQTVAAVSGYVAPGVVRMARVPSNETFFHYRTSSWGWATWWSRWSRAKWDIPKWESTVSCRRTRRLFERGGADMTAMLGNSLCGKNQSWMARWYYNCILHGMVTLYPGRSFVDNIGFDGSGTHSRNKNTAVYGKYRTRLNDRCDSHWVFNLPVYVDERIHTSMKRFYDPPFVRNNPAFRFAHGVYGRIRRYIAHRRVASPPQA